MALKKAAPSVFAVSVFNDAKQFRNFSSQSGEWRRGFFPVKFV
jgi:hypothetical protein